MKAVDILPVSVGKTNGVFSEAREEFFPAHKESFFVAQKLYGNSNYRDAYICLLNSVETYLKHVFLRCATTEVENLKLVGAVPDLKQYDPKNKFGHNLPSICTAIQGHLEEARLSGDFVQFQSTLPTSAHNADRDSFAENYVNLRYRDSSYRKHGVGQSMGDFCKSGYDLILPAFEKVRKDVLKDLKETL